MADCLLLWSTDWRHLFGRHDPSCLYSRGGVKLIQEIKTCCQGWGPSYHVLSTCCISDTRQLTQIMLSTTRGNLL